MNIESRLTKLEHALLPDAKQDYALLSDDQLRRRCQTNARREIQEYEAQHGPLPELPDDMPITCETVREMPWPLFLAYCKVTEGMTDAEEIAWLEARRKSS